jgi:hypothetical protein
VEFECGGVLRGGGRQVGEKKNTSLILTSWRGGDSGGGPLVKADPRIWRRGARPEKGEHRRPNHIGQGGAR